MKQITFLTVQELKEDSIIQSNVDEKILHQSILEFQELELEPLIGKKTYRRLSNVLVSAATISSYLITDEDSELLFDYIKPFLKYGAIINSLNPLHYKVTNKGVQKLTDDSSINGDKSDIEALRNSYGFKKDAYKARLAEYIRTDDNEETVITACNDIDTTFSFTGIAMSDDTYDYDAVYKNAFYKNGYYRRRIY